MSNLSLSPESCSAVVLNLTADLAEVKAPSIRSIIRAGLLAKQSTNEIAAEVKRHHPNSAAAAKSSKHIAFYRSELRTEGLLPKPAK